MKINVTVFRAVFRGAHSRILNPDPLSRDVSRLSDTQRQITQRTRLPICAKKLAVLRHTVSVKPGTNFRESCHNPWLPLHIILQRLAVRDTMSA